MSKTSVLHTILLLAVMAFPQAACAQEAATARDSERPPGAERERAIEEHRAALAADPTNEEARRALVAALAEIGHYDEAAEAAGELANLRGEMLLARGRTEEAGIEFRRAIQQGAPDRLIAELNLVRLLYDRGDREEAFRRFDRFIDVYNDSRALSSATLTAVGTAVRYLGARDPQLFRDALKAYDEAIAADPQNLEARLLVGELFLEKYNSPDARATFREVLAEHPSHPRALLGMARAREFDGETAEAFELVRQSLEQNPNLVPARLFVARMRLEAEGLDAAETEVRRALDVNPNALEALALLAAIEYLRGNRAGFDEVRQRVHRLNPRYAGVFVKTAEAAARQRRYAEAAELAQEAVALEPSSWEALGALGLNQLRLGRVDEARESLERAFRGDPYNVWIKNTLDLIDTYPQYERRTAAILELFLHRDEADLLEPYVAALAAEAIERMAERYGYRPDEVRIEMYPRHADFSVRTVGLAGLGALGVSFGPVVALDSPAARERGTFNWGSTLWHELAHTLAIGASRSRVPRWLTEGLSVVEERRARPSWGSRTTPEFLMAYAAGELPPASRLDAAFARPRSPMHLAQAYHLASLVAEWVEETRGFETILGMLRAYGEGRASGDVFSSSLGGGAETLDREFDRWLSERYPPEHATAYFDHLRTARDRLSAGQLAEAQRSLEAAAELFPVSHDASPYALLAQLHLQGGHKPEAADALKKLVATTQTAYAENLQLAELLEELGDLAGAAAALERTLYMFPYEIGTHVKLAELYAGLGEPGLAVRERRAVVALRPVDLAQARYHLARALLANGERSAARREVLRALEIAPGFESAQDLLLELRPDAGGTR